MSQKTSKDPILESIFDLIAQTGWRDLTFSKIAEGCSLSLVQVNKRFASKDDLFKELIRYIDQRTLETLTSDFSTMQMEDALFEVLMARFERATQFKPALKVIWGESLKNPLFFISNLPLGFNSLIWMLDAARFPLNTAWRDVQVSAFGVLYIKLIKVWLEDETPDQAKTMAELDQSIKTFLKYLTNPPGICADILKKF